MSHTATVTARHAHCYDATNTQRAVIRAPTTTTTLNAARATRYAARRPHADLICAGRSWQCNNLFALRMRCLRPRASCMSWLLSTRTYRITSNQGMVAGAGDLLSLIPISARSPNTLYHIRCTAQELNQTHVNYAHTHPAANTYQKHRESISGPEIRILRAKANMHLHSRRPRKASRSTEHSTWRDALQRADCCCLHIQTCAESLIAAARIFHKPLSPAAHIRRGD